MSDDIVTIQTQLSFHEDSLQSLNDVVTRQQRDIDQLKKMVRLLQENIMNISQAQGESDNSPPPHY